MILERDDIKQERRLGNIVIEPFNEDNLGTNSYDFTLGNDFFLVRYHGLEPYFYGPMHVPDGEPLLLPAGETVLGMTREVIGAARDTVCKTHARSTTRRCGISLCDDAGLGDVGYIDHWTLELTANVQPYAVVYAGQRIGQMVFTASRIARPPRICRQIREATCYNGQYTRDWPANMVPRQYQDYVVPLRDYHPYIFSALSAQPQIPVLHQQSMLV